MMQVPKQKDSVVVIGGGTGTHTILRGLKRWTDRIAITAVVSMADSGGSTGRLRDEFGMLPVGDVRMALAALAEEHAHDGLLLRELFLYRFQNGNGLHGHNLGNLFLTALADVLGSEAAAIAAAAQILRVAGRVYPVTTDNVHLSAEYDDGVKVVGEHHIDEPQPDRYGHRIAHLSLEPKAAVTADAAAAIAAADCIILGPGDLYSSLLANCVVDGVPEAIRASQGRFIFVSNLMERLGQTEGMQVSDAVVEIERYVGRIPDVILINNAPLPQDAVAWYEASEGTKPVIDNIGDTFASTIVRSDLVADEPFIQGGADHVRRSLIRHDSDKLAASILTVLSSEGYNKTV